MNKESVYKTIEKQLKHSEKSIRNKNSIEALLSLFPLTSSLWKVLVGSKNAIETEKGSITQRIILDILIAIDNKIETGITDPEKFKILLEGILACGDVTGLKAKTSNPAVAQLFSEKEIDVILRNIYAKGNVTGVDLSVDQELELKRKLQIITPSGSVKLKPGHNSKIVFGKGFKKMEKRP